MWQVPVKRRTLPIESLEVSTTAPLQFPGQRLVTIAQAARYLAVSQWLIRDKIRRRELPGIKLGKRINLDIADLDNHILNLKKKAA
jgi:excisionase family DNA binding protein